MHWFKRFLECTICTMCSACSVELLNFDIDILSEDNLFNHLYEKRLYRFLKCESIRSGILHFTKRQLAAVAVVPCTKVKL